MWQSAETTRVMLLQKEEEARAAVLAIITHINDGVQKVINLTYPI